ncbi:MAG: DUF5627 domain-containing protein [Bacteroidales bacterium]|jgi:hypothetical protein|nr:DUF5627 domain-containing protein [Bacteroidales bacterium]MEA4840699.1 DUF5627 domain-containing protein [Bacteroidales bacterium]
MKKILIIITLVVGLTSCNNQDNGFPDYAYTSTYFTYQYPVRTLVLGDYIYNNTNDNNHQCYISAGFGGAYSNKNDVVLDIAVDESLCDSVKGQITPTLVTDTLRLMPSSYYSLSSTNKLIIPKGKFNGHIVVSLTDAFFNDPLSVKGFYAIPLRIVSATGVDSILRGQVTLTNTLSHPDCRVPKEWSVVPRDFTIFAVKYINPYHGTYLHRGKSVVTNASQSVLESSIYRYKYNVDDELWKLVTTGMKTATVQGGIKSSVFSGKLNLILDFSDNGDCTVTGGAGASNYSVTGTGKFVNDGDTWGNKKRDAIHLDYHFTDGTKTYSATDTLVIRDRGVVLETITPDVFTTASIPYK